MYSYDIIDCIGVARGCTGCTCTPRTEKKNSGAKFTGEICKCTPGIKCTPEAKQESNFWENWEDLGGGRGYLGSFSVCFESDDWKMVFNFLGKKCAPPEKILAMPMIDYDSHSIDRVVCHWRRQQKPCCWSAQYSGLRHSKLQCTQKANMGTASRRTNVSFRSRPSTSRALDQFSAKLWRPHKKSATAEMTLRRSLSRSRSF